MPDSLNPIVVFKETFRSEMQRYQREDEQKVEAQLRASTGDVQRFDAVEAEPLDSATLRANFGSAMALLSSMFNDAIEPKVRGLNLSAMEVNLEVSAEGQLGFLGTGIKATGTTSFKLTFERDAPRASSTTAPG